LRPPQSFLNAALILTETQQLDRIEDLPYAVESHALPREGRIPAKAKYCIVVEYAVISHYHPRFAAQWLICSAC